MNFGQTILLGAMAGLTISLGLQIGRIKEMSEKTRSFLSMPSAGILLFLFIDIFRQLSQPIQSALQAAQYPQFTFLLLIMILGFAAGLFVPIGFLRGLFWFRSARDQASFPLPVAVLNANVIRLHKFSASLLIRPSARRPEGGF